MTRSGLSIFLSRGWRLATMSALLLAGSSAYALAYSPVVAAQSAAPALPRVKFGKTGITRLIIGSNPFYGYSHFNRILDHEIDGRNLVGDEFDGIERDARTSR